MLRRLSWCTELSIRVQEDFPSVGGVPEESLLVKESDPHYGLAQPIVTSIQLCVHLLSICRVF